MTAAIGMGVVAFLPRGLVTGITKGVYTAVIGDTRVFTDVNLRDNRNSR